MFEFFARAYKLMTNTRYRLNGNFFLQIGNLKKNSIECLGKTKTRMGSGVIFWKNASNNKITFGKNFVSRQLWIIIKSNDCHLIIGDNVTFAGQIELHGVGRTLVIGNNTTVFGAVLICRDKDITIGENCLFSREIEIRSTDVHKIYDLDTKKRVNEPQDVVIGDHVWIGAKAFISKGARIPSGSIVGATSFVNKAFEEENVVIAGTPAKIVKRNIYWER